MPTPYEPVIRHGHEPGDVVCNECHYGLLNHPCALDWCACVCKTIADLVRQSTPPPEFFIPPSQTGPEDLDTWQAQRPVAYIPTDEPTEKADVPLSPRQRRRRRIADFIAKWEEPWAVITCLLYLAAMLTVLIVFPEVSNTWVSVFVLVSGLTSSLTALASVLKTRR